MREGVRPKTRRPRAGRFRGWPPRSVFLFLGEEDEDEVFLFLPLGLFGEGEEDSGSSAGRSKSGVVGPKYATIFL